MFSRKQVMQFRSLDLNECLTKLHRHDGTSDGRAYPGGVQSRRRELPPVHGDSTMIQQVVMNLSVNARDAMLEGGRG